jgi:hypothetical protein
MSTGIGTHGILRSRSHELIETVAKSDTEGLNAMNKSSQLTIHAMHARNNHMDIPNQLEQTERTERKYFT